MMYRALCLIAGVFAVLLGLLLLVAPAQYLSLYTTYDPAMDFPTQRFSVVISGLGALLLLASRLPPGAFAAQFATLTGLVWVAVAGTGLYHYATGVAGVAILAAAAIEIILGLLFLVAARQHRG